ncbi:hypothetical protein [Streptomyces sp. NWU49]|nr:hypothetical protein [Streptomyces sp. NWU49]
MKPLIAHPGAEHGSDPDARRRVVQRTFAHLHWSGRWGSLFHRADHR